MQHLRQISTIFLSVYLLILMVLPCSDAHNTNNSKQTADVAANTAEQHKDIEVCTPFCVCGSCVSAVVLQPLAEYDFHVPEYFHLEISNFYRSLKSDFSHSIWQPPQLL
ncbi:DUF6660 family protein [Flavobacterium psychrotrophum]|uniref:DUF6660 family protein n=1 Tax=Flavobacterium psychrotrophum TaxID=2294119 RepID=UPI0013C48D43|nr:DUF6660 family protein [Flavobacterium psychrotrophum]